MIMLVKGMVTCDLQPMVRDMMAVSVVFRDEKHNGHVMTAMSVTIPYLLVMDTTVVSLVLKNKTPHCVTTVGSVTSVIVEIGLWI